MEDGCCQLLLAADLLRPIDSVTFVYLLVLCLLLILSGLFSGSETALFSLTAVQRENLKNRRGHKTSELILQLLARPKQLLACILIANNLVNVAIVILSTFIVHRLFYLEGSPWLAFFLQVGVITLMIVMIGEVLPKIFSTHRPLSMAHFTAPLLYLCDKILFPFTWLLVSSSQFIDHYFIRKGYRVNMEELSHAIDLTTAAGSHSDERKMLKSIVRFENIDVRQIMKSRIDIIAIAYDMPFSAVLDTIREYGYSRLPVYEKNLEQIKGILNIKDLIPHLDKGEDFQWQTLIRPPYFVPENKKIHDLLHEFQEKKIHLALVVDEYGTVNGLVSLEDILEEIVGEISDEFDEEEIFYSKLDENNYVFEGKVLLTDLSRLLNLDMRLFEDVQGSPSTLAGLIIEISGRIPAKDETIAFKNLLFTIESSDRRRIKRVKVTLNKPMNDQE
jgi:gliding motility-associated protein GldE